jgi:D-alanyl-D-alanine carboxypeptidase
VGVLQDTLARYEPVSMVRAGDPLKIAVTVEGGTEPAIVPIAAEDVRIPVPKGTETQVELLMQVPSVVTAPVARGEQLGEVVVRLGGRVVAVVPAVSPKTVGSRGVRSAEVQLPKRAGVGVQ